MLPRPPPSASKNSSIIFTAEQSQAHRLLNNSVLKGTNPKIVNDSAIEVSVEYRDSRSTNLANRVDGNLCSSVIESGSSADSVDSSVRGCQRYNYFVQQQYLSHKQSSQHYYQQQQRHANSASSTASAIGGGHGTGNSICDINQSGDSSISVLTTPGSSHSASFVAVSSSSAQSFMQDPQHQLQQLQQTQQQPLPVPSQQPQIQQQQQQNALNTVVSIDGGVVGLMAGAPSTSMAVSNSPSVCGASTVTTQSVPMAAVPAPPAPGAVVATAANITSSSNAIASSAGVSAGAATARKKTSFQITSVKVHDGAPVPPHLLHQQLLQLQQQQHHQQLQQQPPVDYVNASTALGANVTSMRGGDEIDLIALGPNGPGNNHSSCYSNPLPSSTLTDSVHHVHQQQLIQQQHYQGGTTNGAVVANNDSQHQQLLQMHVQQPPQQLQQQHQQDTANGEVVMPIAGVLNDAAAKMGVDGVLKKNSITDPNAVAEQWSRRFKLVKIPFTEPLKRGRWHCQDFIDPPDCKFDPDRHFANLLSQLRANSSPCDRYGRPLIEATVSINAVEYARQMKSKLTIPSVGAAASGSSQSLGSTSTGAQLPASVPVSATAVIAGTGSVASTDEASSAAVAISQPQHMQAQQAAPSQQQQQSSQHLHSQSQQQQQQQQHQQQTIGNSTATSGGLPSGGAQGGNVPQQQQQQQSQQQQSLQQTAQHQQSVQQQSSLQVAPPTQTPAPTPVLSGGPSDPTTPANPMAVVANFGSALSVGPSDGTREHILGMLRELLVTTRQLMDGSGEIRTDLRDLRDLLTVKADKLEQNVLALQEENSWLKRNCASTGGIENKIEQAMDLVKSHLMFAVREEVDILHEKINFLSDRSDQLSQENQLLRSFLTQDQSSRFKQALQQQQLQHQQIKTAKSQHLQSHQGGGLFPSSSGLTAVSGVVIGAIDAMQPAADDTLVVPEEPSVVHISPSHVQQSQAAVSRRTTHPPLNAIVGCNQTVSHQCTSGSVPPLTCSSLSASLASATGQPRHQQQLHGLQYPTYLESVAAAQSDPTALDVHGAATKTQSRLASSSPEVRSPPATASPPPTPTPLTPPLSQQAKQQQPEALAQLVSPLPSGNSASLDECNLGLSDDHLQAQQRESGL